MLTRILTSGSSLLLTDSFTQFMHECLWVCVSKSIPRICSRLVSVSRLAARSQRSRTRMVGRSKTASLFRVSLLSPTSRAWSRIVHLQRQLQVGFATLPVESMEVYITVPNSAENLQAFPEPNSRTPFFRRSDNQTINSIQWVLKERKTITLSYVDQQTTSLYEFSVLLGGLLLGTGVSGFLNWLTDASAKARRWNPGTRHPQRQLAVQGNSILG